MNLTGGADALKDTPVMTEHEENNLVLCNHFIVSHHLCESRNCLQSTALKMPYKLNMIIVDYKYQ